MTAMYQDDYNFKFTYFMTLANRFTICWDQLNELSCTFYLLHRNNCDFYYDENSILQPMIYMKTINYMLTTSKYIQSLSWFCFFPLICCVSIKLKCNIWYSSLCVSTTKTLQNRWTSFLDSLGWHVEKR